MADIQAEEQATVPQNEPSGDVTSSEEVQESGKGEEREAVEPTAEEGVVVSTSKKEEQKQLEGEEREAMEPTAEPGDNTDFKEADTSLNEEQKQQNDVPSGEFEGECDINEAQIPPPPNQSEKGAEEEVNTVEETSQEQQSPLEEEEASVEASGGDISDTDKNKGGEKVDTSPTDKDGKIPSDNDDGKGRGEQEEEEVDSDDGSFATAEGTEGEEVLESDDDDGGSREPQRRRRGRQDDSELSEEEDIEGEGKGEEGGGGEVEGEDDSKSNLIGKKKLPALIESLGAQCMFAWKLATLTPSNLV